MQQIIREEKWNEKPGSSGGKFECFPGSDGDIPENGDAAVAGDGGAGRGGGVVAVRRGSGLNTLPDASQEGLLSQGRLEETAFDDMEGKEERLIYKCGYTSETVVK